MNHFVASLLARVYSCNALIAAMQAENQCRADQRLSPAYGFDSFNEQCLELERLADLLRDYRD